MELDGWVLRRLIEEGVINSQQGVESSVIAELFEKLHALLMSRRQYTVPELANTAHELLGLCAELPNAAKTPWKIARVARCAQEHIAEYQSENVELEALTRKLGTDESGLLSLNSGLQRPRQVWRSLRSR